MSLKTHVLKAAIVSMSFVILIFGAYADASGAAHYVDNRANGANNGSSWSNAWESFDDISWSSIGSGDPIYISGGSSSKTYSGSLDLPTGKDNVTITKGVSSGHNGEVIFEGGGITINGRGSVSSGISISMKARKCWTCAAGAADTRWN